MEIRPLVRNDGNMYPAGIILISLPILAISIIQKNSNEYIIYNNKLKIYSFLLTLASIGTLLITIEIVNHPTNSIYGLIIIMIFEFVAVIIIQIPVLAVSCIDVIRGMMPKPQ